MHEEKMSSNSPFIIGGLMMVIGVLSLTCQIFQIQLGRVVWPFFIIAPGVVLFLAALAAPEGGEPKAIVASILTMVGLVLLYQSVTGHWESWAYAWALIAPTSIGLGQVLYGKLKGQAGAVRSGKNAVTTGLTMFLLGAVIFELILGISGFGLGSLGFPVLLIGWGVAMLIRNIFQRRE